MANPNPQAVEALGKSLLANPGHEIICLCREELAEDLQAAEPYIYSQLLTELAEWCDKEAAENSGFNEADGLATAAEHCRELAAKEES